MNTNIILEPKLVGDIRGQFFVPSYQRGYRWKIEEVERLLDDIYSNGNNNYCIQPIVVRRHSDDNNWQIKAYQKDSGYRRTIRKKHFAKNANCKFRPPCCIIWATKFRIWATRIIRYL